MRRYAPAVRCPVFFILQEDDELHSAERSRALVNLLGSTDKTLRYSPGGHIAVPEDVIAEACEFLAARLDASKT